MVNAPRKATGQVAVIQADRRQHSALLSLSRLSRYTRDFGNHIFSGVEQYRKGWIRLAVDPSGKVLGFTCFRVKVRSPETKLYFIGVHPDAGGRGIGRLLMNDLERLSSHAREARTTQGDQWWVALDCCKENAACRFYEALGYRTEGEALEGSAWRYVKQLERNTRQKTLFK